MYSQFMMHGQKNIKLANIDVYVMLQIMDCCIINSIGSLAMNILHVYIHSVIEV